MKKVAVIHLVDTDLSVSEIGGNAMIEANCSEVVPFSPIKADLGDPRICPVCRAMHEANPRGATFAVPVRQCVHKRGGIVRVKKVDRRLYMVRHCTDCDSVSGWILVPDAP